MTPRAPIALPSFLTRETAVPAAGFFCQRAEQLGVVVGGLGLGAHRGVDHLGVLADEDPPRADLTPSRMTVAASAALTGALSRKSAFARTSILRRSSAGGTLGQHAGPDKTGLVSEG